MKLSWGQMTDPSFQFSLISEAPDLQALSAHLADDRAGARVTFDGRVRNHNEGSEVRELEYQAYPALVVKAGQRIIEQEAARFGLLKVVAVHRTGRLAIGESAVWVGVASAHRGAAFDGARAIMERLKYELPVWKKETYAGGRTEWVGPDNRSAETGRAREELPAWNAKLEAIYVSGGHDFRGHHGKERDENPIHELKEVECVAGMGLHGDRYFGHKENFKGQVTFFDADVVDEVRKRFGLPVLSSSVFRRNLIVRGADLSAWLGKRFHFQGVEFEGSEECKPCYWMNTAAAPGVEEFLKEKFRGGLRARILSDGTLRADG